VQRLLVCVLPALLSALRPAIMRRTQQTQRFPDYEPYTGALRFLPLPLLPAAPLQLKHGLLQKVSRR